MAGLIGICCNPFCAELFASNSSHIYSSRLYKSGDIARYRHDGNIEFIGRIDNQVKIRGFRIELGEIESVLSQHPNIQTTVVTVREDNPSDKRIVAYVVAQKTTVIELKTFLQARLPSYMIPSAFVFLEAMPITPNGKIDYRSLPAPDTSIVQLGTEFVLASNPTEELLAKIWTNILPNSTRFFSLFSVSLLTVQEVIFNEINDLRGGGLQAEIGGR